MTRPHWCWQSKPKTEKKTYKRQSSFCFDNLWTLR